MDVLVLNHAWQPLRRVSWQTAFGWVFTGRAEVIESYADRQISSAHSSWPMPSIVRFLRKVTRFFRQVIKFNRRNVWLRDRGRCQYCQVAVSSNEFTYDHIVPRSRGGGTRWENIVVCCLPCNQRKANRTPAEVGMRLVSPAERPRRLPGPTDTTLAWREGMPASWRDYFGSVGYWTDALD